MLLPNWTLLCPVIVLGRYPQVLGMLSLTWTFLQLCCSTWHLSSSIGTCCGSYSCQSPGRFSFKNITEEEKNIEWICFGPMKSMYLTKLQKYTFWDAKVDLFWSDLGHKSSIRFSLSFEEKKLHANLHFFVRWRVYRCHEQSINPIVKQNYPQGIP